MLVILSFFRIRYPAKASNSKHTYFEDGFYIRRTWLTDLGNVFLIQQLLGWPQAEQKPKTQLESLLELNELRLKS